MRSHVARWDSPGARRLATQYSPLAQHLRFTIRFYVQAPFGDVHRLDTVSAQWDKVSLTLTLTLTLPLTLPLPLARRPEAGSLSARAQAQAESRGSGRGRGRGSGRGANASVAERHRRP